MIRFKEVRLYPTEFYLDVYIVEGNENKDGNRDRLAGFMSKRYGETKHYEYEQLDKIDWVASIKSTNKSELKGHTRIVMVIEPKAQTLVHELVHVMHRISELCKLETHYEATEWSAYFIEYLYSEIINFKQIPELK